MDKLKLVALLACCFTLVLTTGAKRFWDDDDGHGTEYYVGNWTTGINLTQWTQGKTFYLGDTLTFTVTGSSDSVVPVSKDEYDTCKWTFPKSIVPPPDKARNVTFPLLLEDNYYISTVEENCKAGLKLMVTALSRPLAPAPPVYTPKTYTVGDDRGWALGVNYEQWTNNKEFYFGDAFKFVLNASQHSVVEVFENAFDYCNETYFAPVIAPGQLQTDGRTVITIIPPLGTHFFVSSMLNDCQQGLKVKLEIEPTYEAFDDSHSPAPSPGGSAVAGQDTSDAHLIVPGVGLAFLLLALLSFI